VELAPSVVAYEELLQEKLTPAQKLGSEIGGEVAKQVRS
jgi:hypothetical protein